ncbi:MAG: ARMT1-like domain-containing protein, partial [Candidatus Omnitrophota bacterium]
MIKEDLKRFVEENYPIVRRLVWSAFNYRYYADYEPTTRSLYPFHFTLTITEAEYLVRRMISAYLKKVEDLYKPGETIFDPHLSDNKEKSRIAYEDWGKVLKKIAEIKENIGNSNPLRLQRAILYYLLKKLATAGAYDLSIQEIREKFQDTGEIPETESLREFRFAISSFNKLFKEVLNNQKEKTKLVILADNHGEFIYLLGFIQYLLQQNPNLIIYLITKRTPVADDVYKDSVWRILDYDRENQGHFNFLREKANKERFYIVNNGPDLQGEDLRSLSWDEYQTFTSKHAGQITFDKIVVLS